MNEVTLVDDQMECHHEWVRTYSGDRMVAVHCGLCGLTPNQLMDNWVVRPSTPRWPDAEDEAAILDLTLVLWGMDFARPNAEKLARHILARLPSAPLTMEADLIEAVCPECRGDGWVTETAAAPSGEPYPVQAVCPKCGGDGVS